jgi:hypothetical protein
LMLCHTFLFGEKITSKKLLNWINNPQKISSGFKRGSTLETFHSEVWHAKACS